MTERENAHRKFDIRSFGVGRVIGAGSVVIKDIPPHSIAVGNPCRVV